MKIKQKACKWKILAIFPLTAFLITGCGSSVDSTASVSNDYSSQSYSLNSSDGFYSESAEYKSVTEEAAESTVTAETNRKLIKTVNMTVETEEYDKLLEVLNQKIAALGGYTEYFSTEGTGTYRYGSMTVRIPKNNLEVFLETLEGASNVTYRQENVEDVTLNYVDVESRKKMLEKEQDRLFELLDQAESLEDILTIESRLTEVQYELESKESQLRTYDNQIDYSTVYLDINEVVRYTPQEQKGTWEKISTGFMENLYRVGTGIRDFLIAVIIHIPNIIVFLVVVGILALIVRFIIKLEQKQSAKRLEKQRIQQQGQEAGKFSGEAEKNHPQQ